MAMVVKTVNEYLNNLPEDRKQAMGKLRSTILKNIPEGFEETISYGMISYVVPHSIYMEGYHCNPTEPVPFISIASQKKYIAFYHMGLYLYSDLLDWFKMEYSNHLETKLDMGKSCIRFKNSQTIPYDLIGLLCTKISVNEYLNKYKTIIKKGDISKID